MMRTTASVRTAARIVAITLSAGYAARVANDHWQQNDQTHLSVTAEDFEFYHQQIRALVKPKPGQRIADYGCGEGSIAMALRRDGFDVVGADISLALVEQCRSRGLECYSANEFLAAEARYDVIIVNNAFFYVHPRGRAQLLLALRRKITDGGRLYLLDEPDLAKRHRVSSNPVKLALWRFFPVYEPVSAGFFDDMTQTARLALRSGFRTTQVVDSWSDYRSHLILGA